MIRNLIFDFGKVLVDYDIDMIVNPFFDDEKERAEFKKIFMSPEFTALCDKEDKPFEEIISDHQKMYPCWEKQLGMFHDRYADFVTGEMPGMRELLDQYRTRGYKLYGLTNWCHVVYRVIEKYDILQMLDGMVVSSDEHLIKPYPEVYLRLLDKYGLKAGECVFADDRQINVDGARAVGMKAILFRDARQFDFELSRLL